MELCTFPALKRKVLDMRVSLTLLFIILSSCLWAQKNDSISGPEMLQRFVGKWEIVPGSLQSRPEAEGVNLESVNLNMTCVPGADGYSVYCSYNGSKELMGLDVKTFGQELLIFEPGTQMIYKLGGLRNLAQEQDFEVMYVTIGKGYITELGRLAFTEYLAGDEGPAGKHIYLWAGSDLSRFKEMSIYYDEGGEEVRRTAWEMRKVEAKGEDN